MCCLIQSYRKCYAYALTQTYWELPTLSFKNDYTTNTNDYDTKKITHAYTRYIGFAYLGPRKIVQKISFNTQAFPKEYHHTYVSKYKSTSKKEKGWSQPCAVLITVFTRIMENFRKRREAITWVFSQTEIEENYIGFGVKFVFLNQDSFISIFYTTKVTISETVFFLKFIQAVYTMLISYRN